MIRTRTLSIFLILFFTRDASAQVFINEVQIAPIQERFIELFNSSNSDVDLTGWYIQRKTATGNSFSSLVTSTQLKDKIIKSNDYFLISRDPLSNSDVVIENLTLTESNSLRIRDLKGENIEQIELAIIDEGKSYQRKSASEWIIAEPSPGTANSVLQNMNPATAQTSRAQAAQTPATLKVAAETGSQSRVVLAGAPIIFEGKIAGLEHSNGTTRIAWSFGDGGSAEGPSVTHTYYYPGEYTAVLDIASGGLTATDKMLVRVILPDLSLRTGGDINRSFFIVENRGTDDLDVSGWQAAGGGKTFTFPKNTILGARRSTTFASEVTGLATPVGNIPELHLPNGSRLDVKIETVAPQSPDLKVVEKPKVAATPTTRVGGQALRQQEASVINAIPEAPAPIREERGLWPWYVGSAFLGVLALLGLRFIQKVEEKTTITADDFEIIEDDEPY